MMTGVVVTAPLSDRVFHAGATGYGWLNGGWGVGAFLSALYAPALIARVGARTAIALAMLLLTFTMALSPFSPWLAIAVLLYGLMGSARGVSGVAIHTSLTVGAVASRISLAAGFGTIAAVYAVAFGSACWPVTARQAVASVAE
jgi:MFS family permease